MVYATKMLLEISEEVLFESAQRKNYNLLIGYYIIHAV